MHPTIATARLANIAIVLNEPKAVLEAYTCDQLDEDQLVFALLACCRGNTEITGEALSLLDQYHRRGMIDTSVFLTAKTELNLLMFSSQPNFSAATDRSTMTALDRFSRGLM